ncbi:anaerobic sulfatase maturase [uncultured Methanofollis sp.]|uniref:anaerobic sulfatase maturase n=1 Tax=uncultured Methanofollis sp. TaxID=262500 RepID=UPI0026296F26|nr:anaerobic sulfatase maturase [uncultured Methanofollis sp.]
MIHLLAKPAGARCNLACTYCFYREKEALYPGSRFRMTDEVLDAYIRQCLGATRDSPVTIAWQGGEPTLMGLDFFRRSVEMEEKYRRPGMMVENTIQTNGTLLDDEWCEFFREHGFLVGISLDGTREMHDAYRVDGQGKGSFDRVMRGISLLREHGVEHNILACVHAANADRPLDAYRFLRDETGAGHIQFIPLTGAGEMSVTAAQWGRFLCTIFDEWVRRDVGEVFVRHFDAALSVWAGLGAGMCVFAPTCGAAPVLEHTGDLYACDHFVGPDHLLGTLLKTPLADLAACEKQRRFGEGKQATLPAYCRTCTVRFACNGGCPKDRTTSTPDGETGLNCLCEGYRAFFTHIDRPMRVMAGLLKHGRAPAEIMERQATGGEKRGRNDPCPCGSGLKYKRCCGKR